jgi:murein DD-endopeptidase MepM/ murein hydrolase activator NlpD
METGLTVCGQWAWVVNLPESPVRGGKLIGYPDQGTHAPGANGLPTEWENNNAVDISVPYGTPVYAPMSGTIGNQFGAIQTGNLPANQQNVLEGLRLHILGNQNEVYLQHLSEFAPGIQPGVNVQEGELIGYSGRANGVDHVHFALKNGNPLAWLKGLKIGKQGTTMGTSSDSNSSLSGCAGISLGMLAMFGGSVYALIQWVT